MNIFFVCLVEVNKELLLNRPWSLSEVLSHAVSFMTGTMSENQLPWLVMVIEMLTCLVTAHQCHHHRHVPAAIGWRLWPTSWKWTRQIWGIWKLRPAYSPETPNLGQNRWCFVPCDLEIWWMTLENNRASLLCCFKLCATFHSHRWIQTGVTVRKRPI